jgi:hypothetical protein
VVQTRRVDEVFGQIGSRKIQSAVPPDSSIVSRLATSRVHISARDSTVDPVAATVVAGVDLPVGRNGVGLRAALQRAATSAIRFTRFGVSQTASKPPTKPTRTTTIAWTVERVWLIQFMIEVDWPRMVYVS